VYLRLPEEGFWELKQSKLQKKATTLPRFERAVSSFGRVVVIALPIDTHSIVQLVSSCTVWHVFFNPLEASGTWSTSINAQIHIVVVGSVCHLEEHIVAICAKVLFVHTIFGTFWDSECTRDIEKRGEKDVFGGVL
jgi:hypothetical protein